MSNAKILNVLNALTADGGGNVLKFLNGIMIIRSDAIALETTFPTPFVDTPPPHSVSVRSYDPMGCVLRPGAIPENSHSHRV